MLILLPLLDSRKQDLEQERHTHGFQQTSQLHNGYWVTFHCANYSCMVIATALNLMWMLSRAGHLWHLSITCDLCSIDACVFQCRRWPLYSPQDLWMASRRQESHQCPNRLPCSVAQLTCIWLFVHSEWPLLDSVNQNNVDHISRVSIDC